MSKKNKTNDNLRKDDFSPDLSESETNSGAEYTYTPRKEVKKKKSARKKKTAAIIISAAFPIILFALFLCLSFTLPEGVIAKNVCSGELLLEGLTAEEAAEKLSAKEPAKDIDFSVCFTHGEQAETAEFSSEDIDFAADPSETAATAYAYGRGGNILKNSWDILLSFFARRDIGFSPSYDTEKLSDIFYSLGAKIYGESTEAQCLIEDNTLTITPPTAGQSHDVSEALSEFNESVKNGIFTDIPITLNDNKNDKLDAETLYEELSREPKNAEYVINGNDVTVTDHVVGITIDKAKLSALVDEVNCGIGGSIDVLQVMPDVTKEQLEQSLFGTTLGAFSSNYSSSSENRAYNVELAASKINGIVLADGAEFSYNSVVGNANAANGFKMATVFSNGKVTEGIGGGVCQISSTLYCAALRADLQITERHNHSLPIGYVPGGQDATVSYGSLDFKFKNNTGFPIKLVATCQNRNVTVSVVGSAAAKKHVEVVSEKISTIAPTVTQKNDPSLPAGQTKVISKGKAGSVYMTYKRVYDSAGALVSETKSRSAYKATPGETAVGTGASAPASSPASSSTSSTAQAPQTAPSDTPPTENTETPETPVNTEEPSENAPVQEE